MKRILVYSTRSFTTNSYKLAKKIVPRMSETERVALECGTISIDREIFNATLNLQKLNLRLGGEKHYSNWFWSCSLLVILYSPTINLSKDRIS